MKCSQCGRAESRVIESRETQDDSAIRRRRECTHCGHRFTTYERIERPRLLVVKKSGERELFDREKVAHGIYKACEKRPIPATKLEEAISQIERQMYARNEDEIASQAIGQLVIESLAQLDEVAYVRFASVYQSFGSIESFQKAVTDLREAQQESASVASLPEKE